MGTPADWWNVIRQQRAVLDNEILPSIRIGEFRVEDVAI